MRSLYYPIKRAKQVVKDRLGLPPYPARYDQLYAIIEERRPRTIVEIGTHDGMNAARMVAAARRAGVSSRYIGFDLFETQTREDFAREFALKPPSQGQVESYLRGHGVTEYQLHRGYSTDTVPRAVQGMQAADLIFIDGGHALETVQADWDSVQPIVGHDTIVVFDDYPHWGIGPTVDAIDKGHWNVDVLPVTDYFTNEGQRRGFQLAKVTRK